MIVRTLGVEGVAPNAEWLFERAFSSADHAFWLDSVDAPSRLARRSYMGTSAGPNEMILDYDVQEGSVGHRGAGGRHSELGSIFDVLKRELDAIGVETKPIPGIDFCGGFVGYLGYECKADCGSPNAHRSDMSDAVLMFANRMIAIDHELRTVVLVAVISSEDEAEADRWLTDTEQLIRTATSGANAEGLLGQGEAEEVSFLSGRGRDRYLDDIARCQAALAAGESYEVCLTDQFHTDASPDPWTLYRLLRRHNPAPFSAYLRLGDATVLSSSPERFLRVDRGRRVEARPIKGTAPRSSDPVTDRLLRSELQTDEKTFAEHLMIVDLLRNDLGRVCEVASVRVPELMTVESYPTVHQLISTITGTLPPATSGVDCVRACFPGGSMTGAPKLRTMEIIDRLEQEARGVYSGAIGYFGLDGAVDLSIVIRTIVMRPGDTTIGAGGAIVMQSDPAEEFDEILLKAKAPMSAIAQAMTGSIEATSWCVVIEPGAITAGAPG